MIREGAVDRSYIDAHTRGFDDFAEFLRDYAPADHLARIGVSAATLEKAARSIASGRRVSFWWTMGVNQGHEAVRTAQAIINLALMTGSIGRPGTGANSITGQCNAMGSRLFSNTTNLLGGHDFTNPAHRDKIARALGIPVSTIPTEPSWAYDQIIDGIESGDIRGLWMIATNGAHSWIHQSRFRELVRRLEFFVVQDMYSTTETASLAHLILPAAGWGEKQGTFINSERRFGLSRQVARAPGQALSDFRIIRLLADAWGCGQLFDRWSSPEAAFQLLKACSHGQPCDITGIDDHDMIERSGGIQWPWPAPAQTDHTTPEPHEQEISAGQPRRLFADGKFFTPDGRARFVFDHPRPVPEPTDAEFPFVLLTGRGSVRPVAHRLANQQVRRAQEIARTRPRRRNASDRRRPPPSRERQHRRNQLTPRLPHRPHPHHPDRSARPGLPPDARPPRQSTHRLHHRSPQPPTRIQTLRRQNHTSPRTAPPAREHVKRWCLAKTRIIPHRPHPSPRRPFA